MRTTVIALILSAVFIVGTDSCDALKTPRSTLEVLVTDASTAAARTKGISLAKATPSANGVVENADQILVTFEQVSVLESGDEGDDENHEANDKDDEDDKGHDSDDDGHNDDGHNGDGHNGDGHNDDGHNDDGHNDDGNWLVVSEEETTIDLAALSGGAVAQLGLAELPAGHYTQIRLLITDSQILIDGDWYPVTIPSGSSSGLKIQGEFEIIAGMATSITLDFDASASITYTNGQGFMMNPVIKLLAVEYAPVAELPDEPTATPSPIPNPTPVVQPTPAATPVVVEPSPTPAATPVVVEPSPTPAATPVVLEPSPTPAPTPVVLEPSPTPAPTPVVLEPSPTPDPGAAGAASPTPDPATAGAEPSPTPDPTAAGAEPTPWPTTVVEPSPAP